MVVLSSYHIFNSRYIYNSAIGKIRCFEPKGLREAENFSVSTCYVLVTTNKTQNQIMIPIPRKNVSLRWWKLSILMPLILRNVPWEKWSFLLTIRHPPLSRGSLHDPAILHSTAPEPQEKSPITWWTKKRAKHRRALNALHASSVFQLQNEEGGQKRRRFLYFSLKI